MEKSFMTKQLILKKKKKRYEDIRILATGQSEEYTTGCIYY